jgi:hypothetical protein
LWKEGYDGLTSACGSDVRGAISSSARRHRGSGSLHHPGDQETPVGPSKPIELKLLTPTHFVVFQHDPAKKNQVSWVHGGPYELAGDTYTESIVYGFGEPFDALNGQKVQFQCRMEGDKWRISGKFSDGTPLDETWVRAPKP